MDRKRYANRPSYFDQVNERRNDNQDLGYDYRESLLQRSLSKYMQTGNNKAIIAEMNKLYVFMLDSVKNIKKTFHYAMDRNTRNLN